MRKQRTIEVPAKTIMNEETFCDLCGKQVSDRYDGLPDYVETVLKLERGKRWSDGGGTKESTEFDVCASCFEARVVPVLETLGLTPVNRESDW